MTLRTLTILICLTLMFAATSCQNQRTKFSIISIDSTTEATSVSFTNLAQNYRNYHGKYVDITGLFGQEFEHFGICADTLESSKYLGCFWLRLNPELKLGPNDLRNMNGKIIKLKGLLDTTQKGHLNSHLGTIRDIYYWEQQ